MCFLDEADLGDAITGVFVCNILEGGVSSASPVVDEFEKIMARYFYVDKDNVLATNCGTSALHLSLIGAGVKPGDDVVLPVLTYAASANAIKYVGANPVFVDVDKDTWLMDIDDELLDGEVYRYAMPVDLYGNIDSDIYFEEKVKLIADCCESLGAVELYLGDMEHFYCFSFNGNKIMTTGAGGLIVHDNKDTIKRLKRLSKQGRAKGFEKNGLFSGVGYNYRMAGINAALGLEQLTWVDYRIERKKEIFDIYQNELGDKLTFQKIECESNYWMTAVLFPEDFMPIPDVMHLLKTENIPTRRIFRPLNHSMPFRDYKSYPVAEMIYNRGLCLPSSTKNKDEDIIRVCKTIKKIL
jgi:perosamine synthetase